MKLKNKRQFMKDNSQILGRYEPSSFSNKEVHGKGDDPKDRSRSQKTCNFSKSGLFGGTYLLTPWAESVLYPLY